MPAPPGESLLMRRAEASGVTGLIRRLRDDGRSSACTYVVKLALCLNYSNQQSVLLPPTEPSEVLICNGVAAMVASRWQPGTLALEAVSAQSRRCSLHLIRSGN